MSTTGYTTLEHLKRSLNNGELPVMTPLSEKAKRLIDQRFVLGDGGLQEDVRRGLRCPAKGCGGYFHNLAKHWASKHGKTIGPTATLREVLSLKPATPLWSSTFRSKMADVQSPQLKSRVRALAAAAPRKQDPGFVAKRMEARRASTNSMEARNLRNSCDAQMRKRYNDCRDRLGREPTMRDFDRSFEYAVARHYGSINAFRAAIGVAPVYGKPFIPEDDVVASFDAWRKAHGRLPTIAEAAMVDRTPYLPSVPKVFRTFGVKSWPVAMSHVAWLLGFDDPNYSPKQREAA